MMLIRFNEFTRLLNKFWPGSISQIDPCEDGVLRRSNVTKFLDACSAKGLPSEDLFQPDDLMEGTSHGLTRVAGTIISLVKWAETSAPTSSHSLPDGDTVNPEPPPLRKRPRIKTGAVDPLHVQPLTGPTRVAVGELSSISTRCSLPGIHRRLIPHQIRLALKPPSHLGLPQPQREIDPRLAQKRERLKRNYPQRVHLRRPRRSFPLPQQRRSTLLPWVNLQHMSLLLINPDFQWGVSPLNRQMINLEKLHWGVFSLP